MNKLIEALYVPFGFLFRILFDFVGNYGIALVIFTLFFRLILLPSAVKQQKASAKTVRMQPKLRRIREKYQDYNPAEKNQKIQQETQELYQREGYSAMGAGCAPCSFSFLFSGVFTVLSVCLLPTFSVFQRK